MASDKRPILSGKRARNRRKRAMLRSLTPACAPTTPECDRDESKPQPQDRDLAQSAADSPRSDKTTSQSENDDELEPGLVLVGRPTTPDFCSVFQPRSEKARPLELPHWVAEHQMFTVHVPRFQETCEGYVTYTLEITTCGEPRLTFQVERRFSEFVHCAAEVNKLLESNGAARGDGRGDAKEGKEEAHGGFKWELPAKTWFRVTQPNALEERRTQLEASLETVLLQQDRGICNLPVLREFLALDMFGVQVAEQKKGEAARPFE